MNITSKQMDAKTMYVVVSAMEKALEYGRKTDMPKNGRKEAYQAIWLLHNVIPAHPRGA